MTNRLTDEQFDEIRHAIPLLYQGGSLEDFSPWVQEWIGPDGGTLSLLNELKSERELSERLAKERREARGKIAAVLCKHVEYRTAGEDRFDCCAECNRITGGYVPWPCATYKALTGEEST